MPIQDHGNNITIIAKTAEPHPGIKYRIIEKVLGIR